MLLRKRGPSTEGVFRKTCNNKNMRDIREQLNSGVEVELEAQPVLLLVGLLKVGLHLLPCRCVTCRPPQTSMWQVHQQVSVEGSHEVPS